MMSSDRDTRPAGPINSQSLIGSCQDAKLAKGISNLALTSTTASESPQSFASTHPPVDWNQPEGRQNFYLTDENKTDAYKVVTYESLPSIREDGTPSIIKISSDTGRDSLVSPVSHIPRYWDIVTDQQFRQMMLVSLVQYALRAARCQSSAATSGVLYTQADHTGAADTVAAGALFEA